MKAKLADVLGRERTLGPAPWFLLSGPVVKRGPDGEVLAEHADAFWIRDDQHFSELVFAEPARVRIEASGKHEAFGPFDRVMAADGVLYGDGQFLAKLAPDGGRWQVAASGQFARDLVIEPAAS
jgi:hypothetical protein